MPQPADDDGGGHTAAFLTDQELADWLAGVDPADPLLRAFASDLHELTPPGADPRFALVIYLRHVAELEAQDPCGVRVTDRLSPEPNLGDGHGGPQPRAAPAPAASPG